MKTKILSMLVALVMMFGVVGSLSANAESNPSIYEIASELDDFSILVAAVDKAGLDEVLKDSGSYTVFAPTNDAFLELLKDLGLSADELLESPALSEILLTHVLSDKVLKSDLESARRVFRAEAVSSERLMFKRLGGRDDRFFVNRAQIVGFDVMASNGVIHVIDKVILPQNVLRTLRGSLGNYLGNRCCY